MDERLSALVDYHFSIQQQQKRRKQKTHFVWPNVAKDLGYQRNPKQCRERYWNVVYPRMSTGQSALTGVEKDYICEQHEKLGNCWARIASGLPGRCSNEIKNYWNTHPSDIAKRKRRIKRQRTESHGTQGRDQTQSSDTTHVTSFTLSIQTISDMTTDDSPRSSKKSKKRLAIDTQSQIEDDGMSDDLGIAGEYRSLSPFEAEFTVSPTTMTSTMGGEITTGIDDNNYKILNAFEASDDLFAVASQSLNTRSHVDPNSNDTCV
jgi:hypothetical protein